MNTWGIVVEWKECKLNVLSGVWSVRDTNQLPLIKYCCESNRNSHCSVININSRFEERERKNGAEIRVWPPSIDDCLLFILLLLLPRSFLNVKMFGNGGTHNGTTVVHKNLSAFETRVYFSEKAFVMRFRVTMGPGTGDWTQWMDLYNVQLSYSTIESSVRLFLSTAVTFREKKRKMGWGVERGCKFQIWGWVFRRTPGYTLHGPFTISCKRNCVNILSWGE